MKGENGWLRTATWDGSTTVMHQIKIFCVIREPRVFKPHSLRPTDTIRRRFNDVEMFRKVLVR
jgi:hypothetical protein